MTTLDIDNKTLWQKVLSEIENEISKANFSTWFKDTEISKVDDGIVFLSVQNAFVRDWIANKYHKNILKILRNVSEHIRGLEYTITKIDQKKILDQKKNPIVTVNQSLPLSDHYIDQESNLNPRYVFDTFVVGPFNELAYTAAQAVLKSLGSVYNPLFVYGNTGHGKTHLIQAIGNHIKEKKDGKKVFYLTSERFYLDYMNAVQANKISSFKEKYRKYDVIIMDDIQFLSSKEKTQEELFHLFNTLYDAGRQIVFSSDKHPNFIPGLEDRLKSRFSAGMIVDIPQPDHESRLAIIKSKIGRLGGNLSEDNTNFIASAIEGNIREIEGVLNSIICQMQIKGRDLNLSEIKNLLKLNIKPKKSASAKEVVKAIATYYNIEENSIYEKTRRKEVVVPRQIAMYILREDCGVSFPLIGEKLGGRDHTTVIHSYEKIKQEIKDNQSMEQDISQIRAML